MHIHTHTHTHLQITRHIRLILPEMCQITSFIIRSYLGNSVAICQLSVKTLVACTPSQVLTIRKNVSSLYSVILNFSGTLVLVRS